MNIKNDWHSLTFHSLNHRSTRKHSRLFVINIISDIRMVYIRDYRNTKDADRYIQIPPTVRNYSGKIVGKYTHQQSKAVICWMSV